MIRMSVVSPRPLLHPPLWPSCCSAQQTKLSPSRAPHLAPCYQGPARASCASERAALPSRRQEADGNIRALLQQLFSTLQLPRDTGSAPGSESAKHPPAQHCSPKACSVLARGMQQRDKNLIDQCQCQLKLQGKKVTTSFCTIRAILERFCTSDPEASLLEHLNATSQHHRNAGRMGPWRIPLQLDHHQH